MFIYEKINKLKGIVGILVSHLTQVVCSALDQFSVTLALYDLVNLALTFVKKQNSHEHYMLCLR